MVQKNKKNNENEKDVRYDGEESDSHEAKETVTQQSNGQKAAEKNDEAQNDAIEKLEKEKKRLLINCCD